MRKCSCQLFSLSRYQLDGQFHCRQADIDVLMLDQHRATSSFRLTSDLEKLDPVSGLLLEQKSHLCQQ